MAKKKRQLDRSRPFGLVYGSGAAAFDQFGILFDSNGEELPGFESVVIPAEQKAPTPADDTAGYKALVDSLQGRVDALQGELAVAREELDDSAAQIEELQGKLDTANVEIARLTALTTTTSDEQPALPIGKDAGKGGKKSATDKQVDDQLAAQVGLPT